MMKEASITVRDGTRIGVAIYAPEGSGRFPALLAASPYRYDNNALPAGPQFLWRETGPIEFYVGHGYAYVHMDVRGSGKSGGRFEFLGPNEEHGWASAGKAVPVLYVLWSLWLVALGVALIV